MNIVCDKCSSFGLSFFSRSIQTTDYIEGNPSASIWIIGLNPKGKIGHIEERTKEDFYNFSPKSHRYFSDFKKVSPELYKSFESSNGNVAHTDIVKCFSNTFPPNSSKSNAQKIINNCLPILTEQLLNHKPKILICNGSPASWEVLKLFPPNSNENWEKITSYKYENIERNLSFWVVLSGYIGRIDDRNKRRLGYEIEDILKKENISL